MKPIFFAIAATMAVAATAPASAVTQILTPDAGYVAATTLLPITAADFTTFGSLSASGYTVTFSNPLEARTVGSSWATWGSPPDTEGSTPRIGYTNGQTSMTFTFDRTYSIFGFEAESNSFDVFDYTVEYFLGAVSQGSISRSIDGNAGARLLAASGAFDSAVVTLVGGASDFSIAQVRVAAVPEPASWAMLIAGFGLVGATMRRRRGMAVSA